MDRKEYIPGACNIGAAEIARRKRWGWLGLVDTIVLWAVFALLDADALWRLTFFFPATFSAMGFLQAHMHFCAVFGFASLLNFGDVGHAIPVVQAEHRGQDRRKAWQITAYAVVVGLVVAYIGYRMSLPGHSLGRSWLLTFHEKIAAW